MELSIDNELGSKRKLMYGAQLHAALRIQEDYRTWMDKHLKGKQEAHDYFRVQTGENPITKEKLFTEYFPVETAQQICQTVQTDEGKSVLREINHALKQGLTTFTVY